MWACVRTHGRPPDGRFSFGLLLRCCRQQRPFLGLIHLVMGVVTTGSAPFATRVFAFFGGGLLQADWNIFPTSWPCVALVSPTAVIRRCKNEPACEHYGDGTVFFQFRADRLSSISRFGGLKHDLWGQCSSDLTLMFGQAWVCFFLGTPLFKREANRKPSNPLIHGRNWERQELPKGTEHLVLHLRERRYGTSADRPGTYIM